MLDGSPLPHHEILRSGVHHAVLVPHALRRRLGRRGHPLTETPLARLAFAEVMRHVLSLSRARNVRESHALEGDALVVTLTWDA